MSGFIQPIFLTSATPDQVNFSNGIKPVQITNLSANANDILYSPDGINIEGLGVSDGINISGGNLETIGNPDIQLVSNSIYVNENIGATPIQTAINSTSAADAIYVSSGSYGEARPSINNKQNIAIICPASQSSTICELINGISLSGTAEAIRVANLQLDA